MDKYYRVEATVFYKSGKKDSIYAYSYYNQGPELVMGGTWYSKFILDIKIIPTWNEIESIATHTNTYKKIYTNRQIR